MLFCEYYWPEICDKTVLQMAVQGSRHQGTVRGRHGFSGEAQYTLMALAALICVHLIPTEMWTSETIDFVLSEGDQLYSFVVDTFFRGDYSTHLGHDQIPSALQIFDSIFQINILNSLYGVIGSTGCGEFGTLPVAQAVQMSLVVSNVVLVTIGSETIGLIAGTHGVHVFDSHARDIHGEIDSNGAAVLLDFNDEISVSGYFARRYDGLPFEISPLGITNVDSVATVHGAFSDHEMGAVHHSVHDAGADVDIRGMCDNVHGANDDEMAAMQCDGNDENANDFVANVHGVYCDEKMGAVHHSVHDENADDKQGGMCDIVHSSNGPGEMGAMECNGNEVNADDFDVEMEVLNYNVLQKDQVLHDSGPCAVLMLKSEGEETVALHRNEGSNLNECGINLDTSYDAVGGMLMENTDLGIFDGGDVSLADNHNNDPLFNDLHDIYFERHTYGTWNMLCIVWKISVFWSGEASSENCHLPFWLSNDNNSECDLCSTCWNAIKKDTIPCIAAVPNQLFVSDPPQEFFISNQLERRLLSKIQVFMTVVILPGGQYAERGLVLNLPVDGEDIAEQLESLSNLNQCMVKFEAGKAVGRSTRQMIRPHLVFEALQRLHENNILYLDIDKYEILKELINDDRRADDSFHEVDIAADSGGCDLDMEEASLIPVDYPVQSHEETQAEEVGSCLFVSKSLSKSVSIYEVQSGEELAFPWLFPTGRFGYLHERPKKVSPHMYFKCWLYNYRGHWRKDISYLLHAATSYDLSLLKSAISMFLRVYYVFVPGTDTPLTAGYICTNPTDPRLIQNSYMFMKTIRGTVAYFRNALNDLLAMVKTLGPPTLFMTLSSDDLHWPELGMMLEDLDYETAASKGSFGSSMWADPLYTALHFDRRFHALMKHAIHGPTQPLGKVVDYFYRVEFQNRGSAHYHMFFLGGGYTTEVGYWHSGWNFEIYWPCYLF